MTRNHITAALVAASLALAPMMAQSETFPNTVSKQSFVRVCRGELSNTGTTPGDPNVEGS
jgi:hypothetical protein